MWFRPVALTLCLTLALGPVPPAAALRPSLEGSGIEELREALPSMPAAGVEEPPPPLITEPEIQALAGQILGLAGPAAYRTEMVRQDIEGHRVKKWFDNAAQIRDQMGDFVRWANDPERGPVGHRRHLWLSAAIHNDEPWRWGWAQTQTLHWDDPAVRAALAHWLITHIVHPFDEGSHRIGWAVMNRLRERLGLRALPALLAAQLTEYYWSFRADDDPLPFLEFMRTIEAGVPAGPTPAGLEERPMTREEMQATLARWAALTQKPRFLLRTALVLGPSVMTEPIRHLLLNEQIPSRVFWPLIVWTGRDGSAQALEDRGIAAAEDADGIADLLVGDLHTAVAQLQMRGHRAEFQRLQQVVAVTPGCSVHHLTGSLEMASLWPELYRHLLGVERLTPNQQLEAERLAAAVERYL